MLVLGIVLGATLGLALTSFLIGRGFSNREDSNESR